MSDNPTPSAPPVAPAAPAATKTAPAAPAKTASGTPAPATKATTPTAPPTKGSGFLPADLKQPADGETPAQAEVRREQERRKYKLKVDGQEQEYELTDDEIAIRLQKGHAADKRMQQSAEERKAFAAFYEKLKADPFEALKDPQFGVDLESLAEKRLADKYRAELEAQQMTEEQRAVLEHKRQVEQMQAERDAYKKQIEDRARKEMDEKVFQETERDFLAALEAQGVEKSYETLYEMAQLGRMNLDYADLGLRLTPAQMAAEVQEKIEKQRTKLEQTVRKGLSGDKLLKYLGDDTVKAVLKASVEKLRAGQASFEPPPKQIPAPEVEEKPRKPINAAEWRRKNLMGG